MAGHHAVTTEKKFTAHNLFQIEQINNSSGFNLSEDLGALASLAGFTGGKAASSTDILLERVVGREFIIEMKEKLSIDKDPYFNTYNPDHRDNSDHRDPPWKATIKKIIGLQKTTLEKNAIIENNVISNYRQNVLFKVTEGGAISSSKFWLYI